MAHSSYMFPRSAVSHHVNAPVCHAKSFRQHPSITSAIFFSNLKNLFFGKLAFSMSFSPGSPASVFGYCIPHVFRMSPKPKMFRIPASRIVALVANFHFWRNDSEMEKPRKPVNSPKFPAIGNVSVAIREDASSPLKTSIRHPSFLFESLQNETLRESQPALPYVLVKKSHMNMVGYSYTGVN